MQRSQQLKLVGGIVAGGLLFALPFARRTPPAAGTGQQAARAHEPALHSVPLYLPAESTPSPAIGLSDQDSFPAAPAVLVAVAPNGKSHLEDNGIPPAMPDMYHSFLEESPAAPPRRFETRPAAEQRISNGAPEQERTHRIVDGDTLARLAQRYWQDAALAEELFHANRDVLSAPDPLPIGVTLKIPPRLTKPRVKISAQQAPLEELPAPVRQPTSGAIELDEPLVPLQRSPN